jgi:hypothetical protein
MARADDRIAYAACGFVVQAPPIHLPVNPPALSLELQAVQSIGSGLKKVGQGLLISRDGLTQASPDSS